MKSGNPKQVNSEENKFVNSSAGILKSNLLSYRKEISLALIIICIFVVLYAYQGFTKNQRHDGAPAILMNSLSYITTTLALITALLFL